MTIAPFASFDDLEVCLRGMAAIQCEEEGLSELDHGLQCAEVLSVAAPDDVELQVAGLLHDVGAGLGVIKDHESVGAAAIRPLVGDRVAELVRLHVDAKRYLVTSDAGYRARLSTESLETLERQGGVMDRFETSAFRASPQAEGAIRLRKADDLAKTPGRATRGLEAWLPALRDVVERSTSAFRPQT